MRTHYDTPEAFAADVAKEAKGAWVNGTYDVNGQLVGIKAYNKWVQRISCNCLNDSGEFPTQAAMKAFIVNHVGH